MTKQITWAFSGKPATLKEVTEQVGAGWKRLVENLVSDLFDLGWDGNLYQIKEKFGGLRFYIGEGSDEIHEAIQAAEEESMRTCERTGEPGERRSLRGWLKVLSDDEYNKYLEEQKNVQS